MIELNTPDGMLKWKSGKHIKGDDAAVTAFRQPREGQFGAPPGVAAAYAHKRKDSFLHLAKTIWPDHKVIKDTEPG
ncbi:hypothetical protein IV102_25845 [bacterium]|nr:hypothetical protein [bacterium]